MASMRELQQEIKEAGLEIDFWKKNRLSNNQRDLLDAVQRRNTEKVKRLVGKGTDPNFTDEKGNYPIHIAAGLPLLGGAQEILTTLLYFGASVDVRDRFGRTPLHIAASLTSQRVLVLLETGCSINEQDVAGRTALMEACSSEGSDALSVVQILLDRNINASLKDQDGLTALHCACKNLKQDRVVRNEIICKLLFSGVSAIITDKSGKMPLCYELDKFVHVPRRYFKDSEFLVTRTLIQAGANYNSRNRLHETWARRAIAYSQLNFLKELFAIIQPVLGLKAAKQVYHIWHSREDKDNEILAELQTLITNPVSLQSLCRSLLRDELRGKLFVKVDHLPLPQCLKSYILVQ
ncbi:ankyrin repeat and SOCS box protein 10-like [Gigantopelta aegis]|uniref:ankyrin repeat and SOCS box protein 10-like n=1 Tax=Gigantopelta aegis TaxID=1735272 RepID=UPI001B88D0DA|nr:ankyrin repeat and SOCS box protein 10-like [Gigantopelta aegis]